MFTAFDWLPPRTWKVVASDGLPLNPTGGGLRPGQVTLDGGTWQGRSYGTIGSPPTRPSDFSCAAFGSPSTAPGDYVRVTATYSFTPLFQNLSVAAMLPGSAVVSR